MKFIKQHPGECFLACICMLEGWDYEQMRATYPKLEGTRGVKVKHLREWAKAYAPEYVGAFSQSKIPLIGSIDGLTGQGILIICWKHAKSGHVLSYENGKILDPTGKGKFETLAQFTKRAPPFTIATITPTKVKS